MARYIKANPKVAQYLRLENDRNRLADGNYLLWQADMLEFGRLTDLPLILEQIGAIALAAHEAREEQDGTVTRDLPTAADPIFAVEPVADPETTDEAETTETTGGVGAGVPVEEPEPDPQAAGDLESTNDKIEA